jgi:hypothetical protein
LTEHTIYNEQGLPRNYNDGINTLLRKITENKEQIKPLLDHITTVRDRTNIRVIVKTKEFTIDMNGQPVLQIENLDENLYLAGLFQAIKNHQINLVQHLTSENLPEINVGTKSKKYHYRHLGRLSNKARRHTEIEFVQNIETEDVFINVYDKESNFFIRVIVPPEGLYTIFDKFVRGEIRMTESNMDITQKLLVCMSNESCKKILEIAVQIALVNPTNISNITGLKYITVCKAMQRMEKLGVLRLIPKGKELYLGKRLKFYELVPAKITVTTVIEKLKSLEKEVHLLEHENIEKDDKL